jgi:ribose 5-phosphate isomerase B
MKRFDIITESDARVLAPRETVMLARGGHITPLAHDTLRDRAVTVVHEGRASRDAEALVPRADIRSLAIASDHTGVALRQTLAGFLRGRGLAVDDLGTDSTHPVDYPDLAAAVGQLVARGDVNAGVVIDAAGIGSCIAANKIPGVRAAMATSETIARYSREHSGANVLTLGAALVGPDEARAILSTWLTTTAMRETTDIERLAKIRDLERRPRGD